MREARVTPSFTGRNKFTRYGWAFLVDSTREAAGELGSRCFGAQLVAIVPSTSKMGSSFCPTLTTVLPASVVVAIKSFTMGESLTLKLTLPVTSMMLSS
jgi:hypothetical protein